MSNKIDGGQSAFDQVTDAAADFFGVGQKNDTCADAAPTKVAEKPEPPKQEAGQDDDVLDKLGDVAGGFWDDVTGSASKAAGEVGKIAQDAVDEAVNDVVQTAENAIDDVADGIITTVEQVQRGAHEVVDKTADAVVEEVRAEINQTVENLHRIAEIPDDIIAGGKEIFLAAEQAKVELAENIGSIIAQHPEEVLADFAGEVFDGTIDLVGDIASAVASGVDTYVLEPIIFADDVKTAALNEIRSQVLGAGCDFVAEHRDAIDGAADLLTEALNSDLADAYFTVVSFTPAAIPAHAGRAIWLQVANGVKSTSKAAEMLTKNPEALEKLARTPTPQDIAADLKNLAINESLRTESGFGVEFSTGVGGEAGASAKMNTKRTGPETYQVSFDLSASAGGGVGEKLQELGLSGNLVGNPGGKVTIEFSGPKAADNAALLLAASSGNIGDLLRLKDLEGGKIVDGLVRHGLAVDVDAFSGKFNMGTNIEAGAKTIDGQRYLGGEATIKAKIGMSTGGFQLGDEISQSFLNDPKTGNAAVDSLLDAVPDSLITDLKVAYGPSARVNLLAEPSISGSVFRPEGKAEPVRAEITVRMDLQFGRSTLKASNSLIIPDVGKLANHVNMSVDELSKKLTSGELSIQDLQEEYTDIASLFEIGGPKIVMETADIFELDALGLKLSHGTVMETTILDPPRFDEMGIPDQFREALDHLKKKKGNPQPSTPQLANDIRNQQLSAHCVRV